MRVTGIRGFTIRRRIMGKKHHRANRSSIHDYTVRRKALFPGKDRMSSFREVNGEHAVLICCGTVHIEHSCSHPIAADLNSLQTQICFVVHHIANHWLVDGNCIVICNYIFTIP